MSKTAEENAKRYPIPRKKNGMPVWCYGTSSGKLCVDTSHPEWVKYFIWFIKRYAGRIKITPS